MAVTPVSIQGDLYQVGQQVATTPSETLFLGETKQLVNAQWPRPVIWLVQLWVTPITIGAGETANFILDLHTVIGSGQSSAELRTLIVMPDAGAGLYPSLLAQGRVPAHDVQIKAKLYGAPNGGSGGPITERWDVACFVAPWGIEQIATPLEREHIQEWGVNYPHGVHSGMLSRRENPGQNVLSDLRWGDRDSIQYTFTVPPP